MTETIQQSETTNKQTNKQTKNATVRLKTTFVYLLRTTLLKSVLLLDFGLLPSLE